METTYILEKGYETRSICIDGPDELDWREIAVSNDINDLRGIDLSADKFLKFPFRVRKITEEIIPW